MLYEVITVIMVVGVNGVGKTTTIGKLAYNFKQAGKSVMLGLPGSVFPVLRLFHAFLFPGGPDSRENADGPQG